jgi:hypothetical protein
MIWLADPPHLRITDTTSRNAFASQFAALGVRPFFIMYADFPRRMSSGTEVAAVTQDTAPYFDNADIVAWLTNDSTAMTGVATQRLSVNRMPGWDPTGASEQWLMIDIEGAFLTNAWLPESEAGSTRAQAIALMDAIRDAIPNVKVTWYGTPHIITAYNQNFSSHRDALFAAGVPFNTASTPLPINSMFADSRFRATLYQIHEEFGDEVIDGLADYWASRQASFTAAMDWISPVRYPGIVSNAYPPAGSGSIVSQRFSREFRAQMQRWAVKTTARAGARCRALGRVSTPLVPLTYISGMMGNSGYWDGGSMRFRWDQDATLSNNAPARFAYAEHDGTGWVLLTPPVGTMSGGCSNSVGVANCLWFNQSDYYSRPLMATFTGQTTTVDGVTLELWEPRPEVSASTPQPLDEIDAEILTPLVEEGANAIAIWQYWQHNGIPGTAAPTSTNGRNRAWAIGQELLNVDHMEVYAAEGRFHLDDAEMRTHVASEFGVDSTGWTWTDNSFRQFLYARASQVLIDQISAAAPRIRRARVANAARASTLDAGGIVIGQ